MTDTKQQPVPHAEMATEAIDLTSEDIEMNVRTTEVNDQKRDDPFLVKFDEPYDPDKQVYNNFGS